MNFEVYNVLTTHLQPTVGEYAYVCARLHTIQNNFDQILFSDFNDFSFQIHIPEDETLTLSVAHSDPVPILIFVSHDLGLDLRRINRSGLNMIVKTVIEDSVVDVVQRTPTRQTCYCLLGGCSGQRSFLGPCGRAQFAIDGQLVD